MQGVATVLLLLGCEDTCASWVTVLVPVLLVAMMSFPAWHVWYILQELAVAQLLAEHAAGTLSPRLHGITAPKMTTAQDRTSAGLGCLAHLSWWGTAG
jgi:hypothetical protein